MEMEKNKQALSPAEWQSVSNSLIELSERMEQASSSSRALSVSSGNGNDKESNASTQNPETK